MPEDESKTDEKPGELFDAPESIEGSTRYSVYDRVLGRYVGGVHDSKPSTTDAKKLAGGHSHAIVAV